MKDRGPTAGSGELAEEAKDTGRQWHCHIHLLFVLIEAQDLLPVSLLLLVGGSTEGRAGEGLPSTGVESNPVKHRAFTCNKGLMKQRAATSRSGMSSACSSSSPLLLLLLLLGITCFKVPH